MRVLLLATYELGHQPFGLASPAAWMSREGADVTCVDLTRDQLEDVVVERADLVGVHLPMHTATRLAGPVLTRVRQINPRAELVAYGLYAPLNRAWLRDHGVTTVLGGEFEADLAALVKAPLPRSSQMAMPQSSSLPRLAFLVPDRRGLPPLSRYATLQVGDERRVTGYTEASRGCRHLCRHCPIVPIYGGQFRIVQPEVVLADIRSQVAAGAAHITFGDPDFLNGPRHARALVEALHAEWPALTYDVTIKVEHLLAHAALLPRLRDTGCLLVISALESFDDTVLGHLAKGHTSADIVRAVALCRDAGLTLTPTFVAFTPWTTPARYLEMLDAIEALDLVEQVAPVQLALRLLIPEGSRMLELPEVRELVGFFDGQALVYPWRHPDPRVDGLHRAVAATVGVRLNRPRAEVFAAVCDLARAAAGATTPGPPAREARARATVPYLNEPWYC